VQDAPSSAGDLQRDPAADTVPIQPATSSEPTTSSSPQEAPPSAEDLVAVSFPDEPLSAESSSMLIRSIIMKLSPPPKSTTPRARKRKAESPTLITGSPFKKVLEEKQQKKSVKKTASSGKRHDVHEQANIGNKKSKINGKRKAEVKKKKDGQEQSSRPKSKRQCRKKIAESEVESATKAVTCVCGIQENSTEDRKLNVDWIKCNKCGKWLHETCAELSGILDDECFYCDSCVD